tara:strand:+ start:130 stop:1386 length:1257 start_codon:yes stop_codon:yes gene_type:complete
MKYLQHQFQALLEHWQDERKEIRSLRKTAFDRFNQLGFPTKKWEEWQFTDFSEIRKNEYRLAWGKDLPKIPDKISGLIPDTYSIIIINGHYQPQLTKLPTGVSVKSHKDFFQIDGDVYNLNGNQNPFLALNTALMNSGILLIVEPDSIIEKPIQIIHLTTALSDQFMSHPRLVVQIGKNSQAALVEHYIGATKIPYFVNPVTQVSIDENASLDYIRILEEDVSCCHTATTNYILKNDARLNTTSFSSGAKLFRHDIKLDFAGDGGKAVFNGLCLTEDQQHHDQHVIVNHQQNFCQSRQLFKYILAEKSSGVFNGKVVVRKNTKQTDADQSNRNLLLSPSALMNANPQLEILSDDVKCSHGSSTGELDDDAIFYLRTRGIDSETAKSLLVHGFANEIIEKVKPISVQDYIHNQFTDWLS